MEKISYKILRQKDGYQYLRTATQNNVTMHLFKDSYGNLYWFKFVKFITTSGDVFIGTDKSEEGISDHSARFLAGKIANLYQ